MSKLLSEKIVGAWELVEQVSYKSNGEKHYPLGKDAKGFIMYTNDGYMSAHLMALNRPKYSTGEPYKGTIEEMAAAAEGYMAYAGIYEVDDENNILHHHATVSMNPTWVDVVQVRKIKFENDLMYITTADNSALIVWKRAKFNNPLIK